MLCTDENCCYLNMEILIRKEINHRSISDDKKNKNKMTLEKLLVSKLSPFLSTVSGEQVPKVNY